MPFMKGRSGNPAGTSAAARERSKQARELAGEQIEASINCLVNLRDHSKDDKTRLLASRELLERACGKAKSPEEAETLAARSALDSARTAEISDLKKRLEKLEAESDEPELKVVK